MKRENQPFKERAASLWERTRLGAGRRLRHVTTELTAETAPPEPIDFSAPSVRYYDDLAARFSLARIVLFMILLVFTVVTIVSNRHLITYSNLYYMVRDINASTVTAQSQSAYLSYPVSTVTPDIKTYRGGLVVVGGHQLTVLSGSGKRTLSESIAYGQPCVRADDKYFLTFGRGENGFAVYNAFGRMYREQTDYPMYDACMGTKGSFAVVTRSGEYISEVILYNDRMARVAAVRLGGYVTALAVDPLGDVFAILSVDSQDGQYATKLTVVRTGNGVSTEEHEWSDTLVGTAAFLSEDRLALVCRDRLILTDAAGDVRKEISFEGREPAFCAMGEKIALIFHDAAGLGQAALRVYDRNGEVSYTVALPSSWGIREMTWNRDDLYLRAADQLIRITDQGQRTDVMSLDRNTVCLLDSGDKTPLICTLSHAYHPDDKDWKPID